MVGTKFIQRSTINPGEVEDASCGACTGGIKSRGQLVCEIWRFIKALPGVVKATTCDYSLLEPLCVAVDEVDKLCKPGRGE